MGRPRQGMYLSSTLPSFKSTGDQMMIRPLFARPSVHVSLRRRPFKDDTGGGQTFTFVSEIMENEKDKNI